MQYKMLRAKIHRAVVTEANLNYVGSITIDQALLDAANMRAYEWVGITSLQNGTRWETYILPAERGCGRISLNGSSARWFAPGDQVIIMAFAYMDEQELADYEAKVVFVDEKNAVTDVMRYETPFSTGPAGPTSTTRGDAR